ncbi:MAG TPA: anti-sigma regulatory factor [Polyangiaceae bacterium]
MNVLQRHELKIDSEDDVVIVRRRVKAIAQERRFDTFAVAAVTTATSELTRNAWTHAGGGIAVVAIVSDGPRIGIQVEFRDQGPGIPDLARVFAGGYSTARSLGLGLSGSRRLVDEFAIDSEAGRGTTITITKWKTF